MIQTNAGELIFGSPDAHYWIQIIPFEGMIAIGDVVRRLQEPMLWSRWKKGALASYGISEIEMYLTGTQGLLGIDDNWAIVLFYSSDIDPIGALQSIEKSDNVEPEIIFALVAALTGVQANTPLNNLGLAVAQMAQLPTCMKALRRGVEYYPSRGVMEKSTLGYVVEWLTNRIAEKWLVPDVAQVDLARLWLMMGKRLAMEPGLIERVAAQLSGDYPSSSWVAFLSRAFSAYALLHDITRFYLGGCAYEISQTPDLPYVFPQLLEWALIQPNVARIMFPGSSIPLPTRWSHGIAKDFSVPGLSQAAYNQFVPVQAKTGEFVPSGLFDLDVPLDLVSTGRRYTLRVLIDYNRQGLLAQVCREQLPGPVFWWSPGGGARDFVLGDAHLSVNACLAAIWHDLHVVGLPAFPKVLEPGEVAVLNVVPGSYKLEGKRSWIVPRSSEELQRDVSVVSGHRRRLPPGQHAGRGRWKMARASSVYLPEGYTFVQTHTRETDNLESNSALALLLTLSGQKL